MRLTPQREVMDQVERKLDARGFVFGPNERLVWAGKHRLRIGLFEILLGVVAWLAGIIFFYPLSSWIGQLVPSAIPPKVAYLGTNTLVIAALVFARLRWIAGIRYALTTERALIISPSRRKEPECYSLANIVDDAKLSGKHSVVFARRVFASEHSRDYLWFGFESIDEPESVLDAIKTLGSQQPSQPEASPQTPVLKQPTHAVLLAAARADEELLWWSKAKRGWPMDASPLNYRFGALAMIGMAAIVLWQVLYGNGAPATTSDQRMIEIGLLVFIGAFAICGVALFFYPEIVRERLTRTFYVITDKRAFILVANVQGGIKKLSKLADPHPYRIAGRPDGTSDLYFEIGRSYGSDPVFLGVADAPHVVALLSRLQDNSI